MKKVLHSTLLVGVFMLLFLQYPKKISCLRYYTKERMLELREQVRGMFQHAYDGYLQYAVDYDELRPLSCDGVDTWGSYSLTLIDALDTLGTMGNYTEFQRVTLLLEKKINFDKDINVSVFETNIRIVGGLLSAHLLSKRAGVKLEPGWPCQGPLLRMAEDVAKRLLPAFDTATGMPYGTVNLRYGVPKGETSITCTAGVGTFLIEFGALSRLTGNSIYEEVALNAAYALWEKRSAIGLLGNHIDVQTGRWTALDSGIGAGVDSFFEYLVKGSMLLQRPDLLQTFHEARAAIDKHLKRDDWYIWAHMNKGHISLPVFQSLEAFWPGILSIIGDVGPAMRTISRYASVWRKFGFLPEFYNIILGDTQLNRETYPLRPELIESAMYLYRATKNQYLLELGEQMLESIEFSAKTKCGYATIRNVVTHEKENRMESFFLSETTKYLYLLFDENNFLHQNAGEGEVLSTPLGECVINSGPYIFNTEAHPIDMSALYCCHNQQEDIFDSLDLNDYRDDVLLKAERLLIEKKNENNQKYQCLAETTKPSSNRNQSSKSNQQKQHESTTLAVDIEVLDDQNQPAADVLLENFERIKMEREGTTNNANNNIQRNQLTVSDLDDFFNLKRTDFKSPQDLLTYVRKFMSNFTLDAAFIRGLQVFDTKITTVLGSEVQKEYESRMRNLWDLYELENRYMANVVLVHKLSLLAYNEPENREELNTILQALNLSEAIDTEPLKSLYNTIQETSILYHRTLSNTTKMQEFLLKLLTNGSNDKKRTVVPLLNTTEIDSLPLIELDAATNLNIFATVRRLVDFKKRMIDTFEKLQNIMQQNLQTTTTATTIATPTDSQVDVSVVKNTIKNSIDTKARNKDELSEVNTKIDTNAAYRQQKLSKSSVKAETNSSDSVWSQLVHAILRTTTTQHTKFDEQLLLEKVRKSLQNYENIEEDYELFTCRRPHYIEIFAYRDFYPTV